MVAVAALIEYAAAMLAADHFIGRGRQVVLGIVTGAALVAACRPLSAPLIVAAAR